MVVVDPFFDLQRKQIKAQNRKAKHCQISEFRGRKGCCFAEQQRQTVDAPTLGREVLLKGRTERGGLEGDRFLLLLGLKLGLKLLGDGVGVGVGVGAFFVDLLFLLVIVATVERNFGDASKPRSGERK